MWAGTNVAVWALTEGVWTDLQSYPDVRSESSFGSEIQAGICQVSIVFAWGVEADIRDEEDEERELSKRTTGWSSDTIAVEDDVDMKWNDVMILRMNESST